MLTLYGIKNCDTVKKARAWLDANDISYHFHDFRSDGLSPDTLNAWLKQSGFDTVINKRSTTWKSLQEEVRQDLLQGEDIAAILEQPTLVKRPVLEHIVDSKTVTLHFGFKPDEYERLLHNEISANAE